MNSQKGPGPRGAHVGVGPTQPNPRGWDLPTPLFFFFCFFFFFFFFFLLRPKTQSATSRLPDPWKPSDPRRRPHRPLTDPTATSPEPSPENHLLLQLRPNTHGQQQNSARDREPRPSQNPSRSLLWTTRRQRRLQDPQRNPSEPPHTLTHKLCNFRCYSKLAEKNRELSCPLLGPWPP